MCIRDRAAIARLTKNAAFRYKAYIEQIDYATNRGLDRNQMERLATLDFVHKEQNLFITGSSGTGKSYLACALGHEAVSYTHLDVYKRQVVEISPSYCNDNPFEPSSGNS